ncbi:AMP-binding enzyme [Micromonospora sediminicola]|uniref:AMP-binding enzyme n=1 Tax=Micromonospora sediminicola TaxID=946078 RepID=UPI003F4CCCED
MYIVDENDRLCPTGVTGNLIIHSPYATSGYIGHTDATSGAFEPLRGSASTANWYRTGDLARRRFDGLLEFRGRRDQQIKFYGSRLEISDLEATLLAHESVTQCAVIAHTGADGLVVSLTAFVVPQNPPDVTTPDEWRAHLRRRFGAAMPPVSFTTMTSLPRNAGGKVDRRQLLNLEGTR